MERQSLFSSDFFFCAVAVLICAAYIYHRWATSWIVVPNGISWVPGDLMSNGLPADHVTQVRAHLRDFKGGTNFANEGYAQYSKNDKPFIAPSFVTWQPEVVLPPSQIQWMLDQTDAVLSIDKCLIKDLEFEYTVPGAWSFTRPFHVEAINKLRLEALVEDMAEEVQRGIDSAWGVDGENWREVNIEETMGMVLIQITTRVFFSSVLNRKKAFITAATNFMKSLSVRSIYISLTPEILRPLVAWHLTRDLRRWTKACAKHTIPLIEAEMQDQAPSSKNATPPAKTLLEQTARLAARSPHETDENAMNISSRLLALNFVAVHTSLHSLVNGLVDIRSPPATTEGVFHELRAEADNVFKQQNGKWSKTAIGQLVKIDSALRESLRISTFKARGLERIVVKSDGVVLPTGQYLPQGTKIGFPVLSIHRDCEVYENAETFDAFRFCASKETFERQEWRTRSPGGTAHLGLINTSETFLAFGHGRHACPGRFLAAYELKLLVAYIAMNYDVKPLENRPENGRFSDFSIGNMHSLQVRRRKG